MTTFYNRELYRARRTLAELPERSRHWADPAVEKAVLEPRDDFPLKAYHRNPEQMHAWVLRGWRLWLRKLMR